jgi:hypothetical protein
MANIYKNAFAKLTTANATFYTSPNDSRAIIQNIQVANDNSNNNNVEIYVHDYSANVSYEIAHDSLSSKETINLAKGPIILQENDYIFGQTDNNNSATLTLAILEINRNQV